MNAKDDLLQIKRSTWIAALLSGVPVYPMGYYDYRDYERNQRLNSKKRKPQTDYKLADFDDAYSESYYGRWDSSPTMSEELVVRLLTDIESNVGVDWNKTTDLEDSVHPQALGTDQGCYDRPITRGVLWFKNNNQYPWISTDVSNISKMIDLLLLIAKYEDYTDEAILAMLTKKWKRYKKRAKP